jgi:hypothetical protein
MLSQSNGGCDRRSPPLRLDSYDFGRDMYFAGIGTSGFVMGAIKTVEPPVSGGLSLHYAAFMQGLRDAIDARIRSTLDGDQRAIRTRHSAAGGRARTDAIGHLGRPDREPL